MIVRIRVGIGARHHVRARFHSPVAGAPRTAILMPGFMRTSRVRVFSEGSYDEIGAFGPELLAASTAELRRIGRLLNGGRLKLPSLEVGLVALTRAGTPPLGQSDRDFLWGAFGLPLYEQLLGPDNETLATECGAHAGLHLLDGASRLEVKVQRGSVRVRLPGGTLLDFGLHAVLQMDRCPCGLSAPRLTELSAALPGTRRFAVAAAAV